MYALINIMSIKKKLQPVVLCGGSGTRLWPLSTNKIPKQIISLGKKGTLLQETIRRTNLVLEQCHEYEIYDPLLIMHHTHILPPELAAIKSNIIYEKYANDTAVAVARACIEIKNRHNHAIMLMLPSDHYIYNVNNFVHDVKNGIDKVTDANIVLYGIDPAAPDTKYGYIMSMASGVKFYEKPTTDFAKKLIAKNALWNSGMFAADVDTLLKSLYESSHNIMEWVTNPKEGKAPSFDIAILQNYPNIYVQHCHDWRWSDVGTWNSFLEIPEVKSEMNDSSNVQLLNCQNVQVINRTNMNLYIIEAQNLLLVINETNILIMPNIGNYDEQLKKTNKFKSSVIGQSNANLIDCHDVTVLGRDDIYIVVISCSNFLVVCNELNIVIMPHKKY